MIPIHKPDFSMTPQQRELYTEAECFAIDKHQGQLRKYTGEPYVNHCINVASILSTVTNNTSAIMAAVLHDTIEDTETTYNELTKYFGIQVADLVYEVTDVSKPEDGNRAARKAKDREHYAKGSTLGQSIKVADLIDNTRTIAIYDLNFAKVYMKEKKALLIDLTKANRALWTFAWLQIEQFENERLQNHLHKLNNLERT